MREIADFLRRLGRYLRPYLARSTWLLLLLLIDVAFTAAWPIGFKVIIDDVLPARDQRLLVIVLSVLVGGVLSASAAALARDYLYAYLSARVLHDVRVQLFTQFQRLSLDFYRRIGPGDLLNRFSADLAAVDTAITNAVPALLLNGLIVALSAVMLVWLEWRLAILTAVGLFACVLWPRGVSRRAADASYAAKQRLGHLADTIQENLTSQPVVKAFGLEPRAIDRFRAQSLDAAKASERFGVLSFIAERLPNVAILITEIVVVGAGILLVFYGERPLGTIVAFHAVLLNITASVGGLAGVMPIVLQSLGGLRRIDEMLAERPTVADAPAAVALKPLERGIALRDLSFGYQPDALQVDGVTIDIRRGQFVALVGPSGSGKSTILNLILRFEDPRSGAVMFDEADIRGATQASLRRQMGVVFQDNVLFNVSIRENLRLADPAATDSQIEAAARAAEIHDFIAGLPEGYETVAGDRGGRFSGGQRQRLALARALVRNPPILLLDEATSALDAATEAAINQTLRRVARGRTVVSVTHRLSTIADAENIVLLDHGRVVEQGGHDELLRRNGEFARLWHKQAGVTVNAAGGDAHVDVEWLKSVPILSALSDEIRTSLRDQLATEHYPADRRVFAQGDPGHLFYVIVRGTVDVVEESPGAEHRIAVLSDGDYFGEMALLVDIPRTASIWTRSPCIFLTLERAAFVRLLERAPQLHQSLIDRYVERMVAEHQGPTRPAPR